MKLTSRDIKLLEILRENPDGIFLSQIHTHYGIKVSRNTMLRLEKKGKVKIIDEDLCHTPSGPIPVIIYSLVG